jgi:sulfur relay (sulfurtransferase) DsrC/TusE family protein
MDNQALLFKYCSHLSKGLRPNFIKKEKGVLQNRQQWQEAAEEAAKQENKNTTSGHTRLLQRTGQHTVS